VTPESVLAKCGWSPFEGHTFTSSISKTFVNGNLVYADGKLTGAVAGERLQFDRAR
jgi:dihydroorotase